jgi:NADP-dependent 3-hydroxy acid dehydrogenase YdfG
VLNIARAVVPEMIAVKSGKIVNVAAMNGTMGKGNMSAYSASKSVVIRGSRRGCRQGQGEIRVASMWSATSPAVSIWGRQCMKRLINSGAI